MKASKPKQPDDWRTPPEFYQSLHDKYDFDFDPCPFEHDMSWNGLHVEWGQRNFVNPPYSRPNLKLFIQKGIEESRKGKFCLFLIPASTDTKLFHEIILPNADNIKFVKGRLKFQGYNNQGQLVSYPAMKGSMLVFFGENNLCNASYNQA